MNLECRFTIGLCKRARERFSGIWGCKAFRGAAERRLLRRISTGELIIRGCLKSRMFGSDK